MAQLLFGGCKCDCADKGDDDEDMSKDTIQAVGDDDAIAMKALPKGVDAGSRVAEALLAVLETYPYLKDAGHYLRTGIEECETAIKAGDEDAAADLLIRVEQEVQQEEDTLAVAFNLFRQGRNALGHQQVRFMLEYLGFPARDEDAHELIDAVDVDHDHVVSLVEFQMYVGRMGGSFKLFQKRRFNKKVKRESLLAKDEEDEDATRLREDLLEAGFQEAAQAYWRLVMPLSELRAAACLKPCQKNALRHIRAIAKSNHERAVGRLQMRLQRMGHKDSDLWMTLAWIREHAPIIIQVNFDGLLVPCRGDTHYRNQFETGCSGGLLQEDVRRKWERRLFAGAYDTDDVTAFDRVKYGVIDPMNDYRGVARTEQYGDSYLILKDVRLRCTLSSEDSSQCHADRLAVLDYYAHVLVEYTDRELEEVVRVANAGTGTVGDSCVIMHQKYKEVQIHGEVAFAKHVERFVAADRHKEGYMRFVIKEICDKFGWSLTFVSDEKERRQKERMKRSSTVAWKDHLERIAEKNVPDAPAPVAHGLCVKGCSRPVRPGVGKNGKPFTTCCRGCAMGFGHDMSCGESAKGAAGDTADGTGARVSGKGEQPLRRTPSIGPGFCKHGCGRPVNPGTTAAGRQYDTCCRGCARGHHDAWCGQTTGHTIIKSGMCRMGCNRLVGVYKSGRKADICCKGCSLGEPHSDWCNKKHVVSAGPGNS